MSKPNLPPLPQMDVGVSGQVKFAYSQEALTAYAEEAVRQALAAQDGNADPKTMEEIHRLERERSPWRLPKDPTLDMLEALRTGSRKDWPSDELCRVRYAALRSATLSAPPEPRDG